MFEDAEEKGRQPARAPLAMDAAHLNADQLFSALIRPLLQPADGIGECFIDARIPAVELRVRLAETIDQSIAPLAQ